MTDSDSTPGPDRSGSASTGGSSDPKDLEDLDPQQFVGESPAGDAHPGEFLSTDQSGGPDPETGPVTDGETDGETDGKSEAEAGGDDDDAAASAAGPEEEL